MPEPIRAPHPAEEQGLGGAPWPPPLRGLRAAFTSFSRLPLGGFPYTTEEWRWAAAHLPCVGIAIGAASALLWAGAGALGLSGGVRALLALAGSILLSGALHEDGLADAADGLGGAHGGKRALEIMKDSRIGSYGALALAFSLLFRLAALAELRADSWFLLVEVHCLARIGPVWLMHTQPYVTCRVDSKSARLFPIGRAQVAVALAWGCLTTLLGVALGCLSWTTAAASALLLGLLTWAAGRHFRAAVGGVTGDLLGALEQAGEVAAWLSWLARHAG